MDARKLLVVAAIVAAVGAFVVLNVGEHVSLQSIQAHRGNLLSFYAANRAGTALVFAMAFIVLTALALPVAGILSIAAGAVFGLPAGLMMVVVSANLSAVLTFMLSRYLFRDWVLENIRMYVRITSMGLHHDGVYFLFLLRMTPVPFAIVNLAMGVTDIRASVFAIVTLVGTIPAFAILVNAGTRVAEIGSMSDIFSTRIVISFALIGALPLLARLCYGRLKRAAVQELSGYNTIS
jgi:uncharacterized membrane protein YdjX (TVP38/TMEM64 family)